MVIAIVFQPALILAQEKGKEAAPAPAQAVDEKGKAVNENMKGDTKDEELAGDEWTDEDSEDWDLGEEGEGSVKDEDKAKDDAELEEPGEPAVNEAAAPAPPAPVPAKVEKK